MITSSKNGMRSWEKLNSLELIGEVKIVVNTLDVSEVKGWLTSYRRTSRILGFNIVVFKYGRRITNVNCNFSGAKDYSGKKASQRYIVQLIYIRFLEITHWIIV